METKITIETFKETLERKIVTGYIWMVEGKQPVVFKGDKELEFNELYTSNRPHNKILEAYIYYEKTSYHIKNIDGNELVFANKTSCFSKDTTNYKVEEGVLFPSHINEISHVVFNQIYKLQDSISGPGFKTWQPVARLFTGFSNQPKNN